MCQTKAQYLYFYQISFNNPAFVTRTHILQSGLTLKRIRCREPVLKSGIMGDLRMRGMPDQVGHDGKGGRRKRWQTRKRADMTFGGRARLRFHPSHNHRFEWISHNKSHVNPRTDMANWPGCVRSVKFYWYFAWFTNFLSISSIYCNAYHHLDEQYIPSNFID